MQDDYKNALKQGEREYRRAISSGCYPYPPVLDTVLAGEGALAQIDLGVMDVPLTRVIGTKTEGRSNSFASNFMPLLQPDTEFAAKWSHLYDSHIKEGIHDSIKAYEFMKKFYVEEGNKRVSVLKYVGADYVSADVIRIMPKRTDDHESRLYYEFLDFYRVAPTYDIDFSEEGSYAKFAQSLGQDLEHPWSEEVMETVRAALASFESIYLEKGGGRLPVTACDALLIYLQFYTIDSLLNDSRSVIENRLERLWKEILTSVSDNITLIDRAEDVGGNDFRIPILNARPVYTEKAPLKAAFIYNKSPENSSWLYGHELGRNHVDECFAGLVRTSEYENCGTDEKLAEAIDKAVADGAGVIFTTSPVMMAQSLRAAIHYPKVHFLNCSINLVQNAVRTYYSRMYEAKFLMGAVAGCYSESGRIGYLADYPIYGTFANINAFAIGAAYVNPRARIYLKWVSSREAADLKWRDEFRQDGVDVISGPDIIKPKQASREYGIYKPLPDGSIFNLAAPVYDWGKYYEIILRTVLNGSYDAHSLARKDQSVNYYLGMEAGVVDVFLSGKLSYYTRKLVRTLRTDIVFQQMLTPFDGELRSQTGVVKEESATRLTNEQIITMNWLNDNVIGSIPETSQLTDSARETVSVSGVIEGTPGAAAAAAAQKDKLENTMPAVGRGEKN